MTKNRLCGFQSFKPQHVSPSRVCCLRTHINPKTSEQSVTVDTIHQPKYNLISLSFSARDLNPLNLALPWDELHKTYDQSSIACVRRSATHLRPMWDWTSCLALQKISKPPWENHRHKYTIFPVTRWRWITGKGWQASVLKSAKLNFKIKSPQRCTQDPAVHSGWSKTPRASTPGPAHQVRLCCSPTCRRRSCPAGRREHPTTGGERKNST